MDNNFEERGNMSKSEILERSRKLKKDEGQEFAESKGFKLGEQIGLVAGLIVAVIAFFMVQEVAFWAVCSIGFAIGFGESLPIYRFTKKIDYLAWTITFAVFAIFTFAIFIGLSLGWIEPATIGYRWWGR